MDDRPESQPATPKDLFGARELLQLVAKKLSSQMLLFSLAVLVILVISGTLYSNNFLVIAAILFVFMMATIGYLFAEQKRKLDRGDETVIRELVGQKIEALRNPEGELAVQVWTMPVASAVAGSRDIKTVPTDKSTEYRIGEKIIVCFRATRDCYLTLLNIGSSGNLTMLFPNALHQDNFVRAHELYQIPAQGYGFEYQLQGPPGVEKLKAIATLEKVRLMESHFTPDGPLFDTRAPTAAARDITVIKGKVDTLPSRQWAEATWEFRVSL